MTENKFPSYINKIFEIKYPSKYLEPIDRETGCRKTNASDGIGSLLELLRDYSKKYDDKVKESLNDERKQKETNDDNLSNNKNNTLRERLIEWNPEKDSHITGDPYRTIFIGRLDYKIDEIELNNKFATYGEIDQVRVVRDNNTQESRGYAFIVYKNRSDAQQAFQRGNGMMLNDRKIVVDIERGRVVKNWKPRRLGGGLGGRHYTSRLKVLERNRNVNVNAPVREQEKNREMNSNYGDHHHPSQPPTGPQSQSYNQNFRQEDRYGKSYQSIPPPSGPSGYNHGNGSGSGIGNGNGTARGYHGYGNRPPRQQGYHPYSSRESGSRRGYY